MLVICLHKRSHSIWKSMMVTLKPLVLSNKAKKKGAGIARCKSAGLMIERL